MRPARKKLAKLLRKYERGLATAEEIAFIEAYDRQFDARSSVTDSLSEQELDETRIRLLKKVDQQIVLSEPPRVVPMRTRILRRVAVAAAMIFVVSSTYLYFTGKPRPAPIPVTASPKNIAPGGSKARLILANGSAIVLDSVQNGTLTQQGNTTIRKLAGGGLVYTALADLQDNVLYNTLSTPRGGQYQLKLPDGSQVWLNSASSIKYPVAFTGKEREVEITGEAYFEVAKDRSKPFRVKLNEMVVEVLGTHFNINGFTDEASVRTTLLEGAVKVIKGASSVLLQPGQQAVLNPAGNLTKATDVDPDKVMSWKEGWFEFDQADLPSILRQVSRWYDVDIVYEGWPKTDKFGGRVSKNVPLSEILRSLEANGNGVNFRQEGNKLIVKP